MAEPPSQLPSEAWNHVFGYLSAADKFNVRASCKYFRKVVDHGSLWRNWAVVLTFKQGSYNSRFWATLRRRKVARAVVRSSKAWDWTQVAGCLPALSTLVLERSSLRSLDCVKCFPHLKHLVLRSCCVALVLDRHTVFAPQQLTHLSMCHVPSPTAATGSLISAVSRFTSLTSLVCHQIGVRDETLQVIISILRVLPKLQHLSLSAEPTLISRHRTAEPPADPSHVPALSSLELTDCTDHSLPKDAMKLVPGLKSLAVFYKQSHHEMPERGRTSACHLNTWLSDLPQLSNLVIVKGPPVKEYVSSIPATVTSLTLCVAGLLLQDLADTAARVPGLLHLHVDPWPSHLGASTDQIPLLFPRLRRLKIRHEHVPQSSFLSLRCLQHLEYLEVLDSRPRLSELTGKLQVLTDYRVQVACSPRQRDVTSCSCVFQVY